MVQLRSSTSYLNDGRFFKALPSRASKSSRLLAALPTKRNSRENPGSPWTETIVHDFGLADGEAPASPLLIRGGALYGTTQIGTAFKLIP